MMTELVSLKKDSDNLSEAYKKFEPDSNGIVFCRYEDLIVKILEAAMDDKYDNISYWLYDCECGKNTKQKIMREDGTYVIFNTISDLYNLIVEENI